MKIFTISQMKNNSWRIRKLLIFLFWLLVWQMGAMLVHNSILLAGPIEVMKELEKEMKGIDFYQSIFMSLIRIMSGFLLGLIVGVLLGVVSSFKPICKDFLAPLITLLKSIPIASFVVLILIWAGSKNLSIYISFLVVFPNVYLHTVMGFNNADQKMLQMANVFQMSAGIKLFYIYLPSMLSFLISSIEVSIGMSFKSGVAAEVIGTPEFSFGEKLYMSKIHLNTAGVFAWTLVVILISYGMEKLVLHFMNKLKVKPVKLKYLKSWKQSVKNKIIKKEKVVTDVIQINNLSKSYEGKRVLDKINITLEKGRVYCLMGPSGCGKTTLFHILLGLVKQDFGKIIGMKQGEISAVFQEPRLLEDYEAIENAFLFGTLSKGKEWEEKEFTSLLPKESMHKLGKELSGGMQRRVAILRAMNFEAPVIILDEPFAGLDEETKKIAAAYIMKKKENKTILVSTHNKEDVILLEGEIIDGNESGFDWNYGRTS